jgi:hypothetical protein
MPFDFIFVPDVYNLGTNATVVINPTIIDGPIPANTVFSILPVRSWLSIAAATGIITATTLFSSLSPEILYTVSAEDAGGTTIATAPITFSVSFEPKFQYPYSPYVLEENISTSDPLNNKNIYPSYFISNLQGTVYSSLTTTYPTLTDLGLVLNTTTGVISGTPSLITDAPVTYTIRAINNGINFDTTLSIVIIAQPTINYPQLVYSITQGVPISIMPIMQNQYEVTYSMIGCSYTLNSYKLPVGLSFDTETGEISGTPTMLTTFLKYTISISNIVGSATTTLILNIVKEFLAPPVVADNFSSNTFLTDPTIEMRRKVEILKYKKNSANLTKQQYYSRLAKGYEPYTPRSWGNQGPNNTNPNISGFPQVGNSIICNNNSIICGPTSSSDVPGPVINLCFNRAIPVVGYNPPNRFRTNIGFKWPFRTWQRGDNGFPVGKAGTD